MNILKSALGEPLPIYITCKDTGEKRKYFIKQLTFRQILEIAKILLPLKVSSIEDFLTGKKAIEFMFQNINLLIKIISIAIKESDEKYLIENLTPAESYDLVLNILQQIGVQDFQKSILGIMPMSLLNQRELIALCQKPSIPSPS